MLYCVCLLENQSQVGIQKVCVNINEIKLFVFPGELAETDGELWCILMSTKLHLMYQRVRNNCQAWLCVFVCMHVFVCVCVAVCVREYECLQVLRVTIFEIPALWRGLGESSKSVKVLKCLLLQVVHIKWRTEVIFVKFYILSLL